MGLWFLIGDAYGMRRCQLSKALELGADKVDTVVLFIGELLTWFILRWKDNASEMGV